MTKLRVHTFSISLDGYGAGPDQDLDNPLGVGGMALHEWVLPTRTFAQMQGEAGGESGVDDDYVGRGMTNLGAWILGRNMFGPIRGPWPDDSWTGWWGENPPYHVPVFVLTNHWNQVALDRAKRTADVQVQPFYGSLYLNLGHSYELLGDQAAAQRYYQLAADLGYVHQAR